MPKPTIPKRVFAVVGALTLTAFLLGLSFSVALTHRLAPCIYFGIGAAQTQHITVVEDHRGYLAFSNGVTVTGLRLLPLALIWVFLSVSGRSKPAREGQMKTGHFESGIAHGAAIAALMRDEPTQRE